MLGTATTDDNGNYVFRDLQGGSYVVSASTQSSVTAAQTVTVAADSETSASPLVAGTFTLNGTVLDPLGQPVASATGFLAPTSGGSVQETTTAADGAFSLGNLAAGPYSVLIQATGFALQTQNIALTGSANQDFTLLRGASVSGNVSASGQAAVSQATVLFLNPTTGQPLGASSTDANGNYSVPNLAAGPTTSRFSAAGFQEQELTDYVVDGSGQTLNIALQPTSTSLGGTVTDNRDVPIMGATVAVLNANGETVFATLTDVNGGWSTDQLAPGNYTLQVTQNGYYPAAGAVQLQTGSPAMLNSTLVTAATDDVITPKIDLTQVDSSSARH